jgi:hypothetical protein
LLRGPSAFWCTRQAAETVKNLHIALQEADTSLHTLDALLSSVAETSQGIDDRLTAQQRIIFDMHEKRTAVEAVEALLKVDERMQEEMDIGNLEQVARLYRESKDGLAMYRRFESVERVRGSVEEIKRMAVAALRPQMDRKGLGMLLALGEESDGLLEMYIDSRMRVLEGTAVEGQDNEEKWAVVTETVAVCREVLLSGGDAGDHGRLQSFVTDSVQKIVRDIVDQEMEANMKALAAAGGFDVSGVEHVEALDDHHRTEYGGTLPTLFEIFDHVLERAHAIDHQDITGAGVPASTAASSATRLVIAEALARHIRGAYTVVGARAFRAMKEMMMRLLLSEGDDARFLKVLIKSLEVSAKQDFGLVEKSVEAWVAWDGCVSKMDVLECLDAGCRDMLGHLCDLVRTMIGHQGRGQSTETTSTSPRNPSTSSSIPGSSSILEKQFIVPATLSRMHEAAPVAGLCLASSLSKVRSGVVDAETNERAVAETIDLLTSQYVTRMTQSMTEAVSASFERDVLGQTVSPPVGPSQTALDVVRLVLQVKTDGINTIWATGAWSTELLRKAVELEIDIIGRRQPISKSAFQQMQVDVAFTRKRVGEDLAGDVLSKIMARVAPCCSVPAPVEPLRLERIVDAL